MKRGFEITGLDAVPSDITVYHAGTAKKDGQYFTSGGRVLGITATADTLEEAVRRAYEGVGLIHFKNEHFRTDIGRK